MEIATEFVVRALLRGRFQRLSCAERCKVAMPLWR